VHELAVEGVPLIGFVALIYICVEIRHPWASRWILLAHRANDGLKAGTAAATY